MPLQQARAIAHDPRDAGRVQLVEALDVLGREVDRLEALADDQQRLRTLGGIAPPITPGWERGTLPPPPSASDPAAPAPTGRASNAHLAAPASRVGWRCTRCSREMKRNLPACPNCTYTVFEPILDGRREEDTRG